MKITLFDRYVSKEFIKPVLGSLVLIVGILIFTRIMDDIRWSMDKGQPLYLSVYYWLHHIPEFTTGILPMCMVFATSYTIGILNKNNELTAIMVGGNSFLRITMPMLIIGLFISVLTFVVNDTLVNYSNQQRELYRCYLKRFPERDICDAEFQKTNDRYNLYVRSPQKENQEYFVFADRFVHDSRELLNVDVLYLESKKLRERISAEKARYEKGKWYFFKGTVSKLDRHGKLIRQDAFKQEFFPIYLPLKRVTIKERKFSAHFVKSNALSFRETEQYIRELKAAGKPYRLEQVELHAKIAMPFMAFVLTFLGAATGTRLKKAVIVLAFSQSLLLAFIYILFLQTGKIFGREGLVHPMLAAWFGNLLFFAVGYWIFRKSRF